MDSSAPGKTILVLISHPQLNTTVSHFLQKRGFEVTDQFDAFMDFDCVFIDSFFYHSGMARFVKREKSYTPVILVANELQILEHNFLLDESLYEVLTYSNPSSFELAFENWLERQDMNKIYESQQFGKGLWVHIMTNFRKMPLADVYAA